MTNLFDDFDLDIQKNEANATSPIQASFSMGCWTMMCPIESWNMPCPTDVNCAGTKTLGSMNC